MRTTRSERNGPAQRRGWTSHRSTLSMGSRSSKKIVRVENFPSEENQKARVFPPATLSRVARCPGKAVAVTTGTHDRRSSQLWAVPRAVRYESSADLSAGVQPMGEGRDARGLRGTPGRGRTSANGLVDRLSASGRFPYGAWAFGRPEPPAGGLTGAVSGISPRLVL